MSNRLEFKFENTLIYTIPPDYRAGERVAAFDLDWTLVYSEHHLFPSDPDDVPVMPGRLEVLKKLHQDGWSLVVFTNQYAVSKKNRLKKAKRVANALRRIGLPMAAFIAVGKSKKDNMPDKFRKPGAGMWTRFCNLVGTPKQAFFCGDAAGRPQDFSDSDREFAKAAGIEFKVPEQMFAPIWNVPISPADKLEMVIFVGAPGCGKTTAYNKYYKDRDYVWVNQDTLKTKRRVHKAIQKAVLAKKSMVIDSCNPELARRQEYIKLAPGYRVTVVYFVRDGRGWNKLRKKPVPTIVYHMFFKRLDPPAVAGPDFYRVT